MRCASNNRVYGCRPQFPRFLLFRSWYISGYIRFWRENVPNIKYFQFFSEKTRLELLQITGMAFISRDLLSCPCLWPGANKLWLGANTGTGPWVPISYGWVPRCGKIVVHLTHIVLLNKCHWYADSRYSIPANEARTGSCPFTALKSRGHKLLWMRNHRTLTLVTMLARSCVFCARMGSKSG